MTEQLRAATAWSAEVRDNDAGLDGLGGEWDDLAARCATATPFQSYAWLRSWWQTYGRPGRLRLTLVRHDGRLVAAAPMLLRRRAGCPVLTPLGGPFSDFTDVLLDGDFTGGSFDGDRAAAVLAGALLRQPGWQVLDFPECRPEAAAGTAMWRAWPGRRWRIPASRCLELPAAPIADLVRDLPTHARKTVRRRLNQLTRAGIDVRETAAGDAGRAVAGLLALHGRQWQGRGGNPQHLSPAFAALLGAAVPEMIAGGQAALYEYRDGERLVASSLILLGHHLVGGYLYGADPALREKVDVTTLLLADTLPLAYARGSVMSMLRGAEPHKLVWQPREVLNERLLLVRPGSAAGAGYAAAARTGRGAVEMAKRRAPWLRDVRDRLHSLGGAR